MKNKMGREGEGENSPNLDQEVEEKERKKMMCLVLLECLQSPLARREMKKEEEGGAPAADE